MQAAPLTVPCAGQEAAAWDSHLLCPGPAEHVLSHGSQNRVTLWSRGGSLQGAVTQQHTSSWLGIHWVALGQQRPRGHRCPPWSQPSKQNVRLRVT